MNRILIIAIVGVVILISGSLLAVFLTKGDKKKETEEEALPNCYYDTDYDIWQEGENIYAPKILENSLKIVVNQTNPLNMPVQPIQ